MTFGETGYFALAILVVALLGVSIWLMRWRHRARESFAGPQSRRWQPSSGYFILLLLVAAGVLMVLAAARPQWGANELRRERVGLDVVVVLDVSYSMQATDAAPSRMDLAVQEVNRLLDSRRSDRVGLVVFAGTALIRSPLTTDTQAMQELVRRAETETGLTRAGSDMGAALALAGEVLSGSEETGKAVILISDGEDHAGAYREQASALAATGVQIFTAGVGSEAGALLVDVDPRTGQTRPRIDSTGQQIRTRLNPVTLQEIAASGNGAYLQLGGQTSLLGFRDDLNALQQSPTGQQTHKIPIERFQYFVAAAIILLVLRALWPERLSLSWLNEMRRRPAFAMLAVALLAGACSDSLYNQTDSANQKYLEGRFGEALVDYQELQADRPDIPEFSYNAGNTLHRLGQFERAVEESQRALPHDTDALGVATYYSIGNHYLALGRYLDAYEAYRAALLIDQHDEDAKYNLEVALALLQQEEEEQQEQEQPQTPGEGEGGEPQEGEQGQPGEPQEGEGEQEPGTPSQPGEPGQPGGTSARELEEALAGIGESLSVEDALRILDLLREQQQQSPQSQGGPPPPGVPDY